MLLLCIAIISTASECKKPKPPAPDNPYGLPNATQTGANIFACRVNGSNWISDNDIYHLGGGIKNDTLGVGGSPKTTGFFEAIDFNIFGNLRPGQEYNLGNNSVCIGIFRTNKTCLGYSGSSVTHAKSISGNFKLTKLDTSSKIMSGVFNCIVPIPGCDTLKITDGRFDIKYN